jgi:hypothetical protein
MNVSFDLLLEKINSHLTEGKKATMLTGIVVDLI